MSAVTFEEIRDALVNEIVVVTNAYVLLTDFAFPIVKQQLLSDHYPFFVGTLLDAFRGQVLIAVCRLFDPDDDARHASLTNFLRRVAVHHAADQDVDPKTSRGAGTTSARFRNTSPTSKPGGSRS